MHPIHSLMASDANSLITSYQHSSDLINHWAGKKILITGSSGLIGLNFLMFFNQLSRMSIPLQVVAAVNARPVRLLEYFSFSPNIRFVSGNLVEDTEFLRDEYDTVIHAASYGQPNRFMAEAFGTMRLNSGVLMDLAQTVRHGGDFLFTSTSEVYHSCPHTPHAEHHIGVTNTDHPRACYIEGKRFGEAVTNLLRADGFNAVSARVSMAYGPGTRPEDARVINQFISRAINQGHLKLMDSGEARRGYLYVSDAIDIMIRMIVRGKTGIYNCGGISGISIRELAEQIGQRLSVAVEVPDQGCGSVGAPAEVLLDQSLVYQHLGKSDFVSFSDGLDRTIAWQKEMYHALNNA